MLETILFWVVTILIGLITAAFIYARWNYGTLEKTPGVPAVVPPAIIGGSDPFMYKNILSDEDTKNVRKYGPIYGYYEGREPHIYISDPELIRLIFIKDFDHFHNKRILDFGHPLINEMMDILPYEKWKVVRNHLSPQLTTGKIRSMSYQMLEAINEWSQKVKSKTEDGYTFAPKKAFTALTTDVIARCAFGTKINAFDDTENTFTKYLRMITFDMDLGPILTIVSTFPFLMSLSPLVPPVAMDYFGDLLKSILNTRRKSNQEKINDFVDCMNEMIDKCSTNAEYKKLGITETTVMCQAMIFLIAGFETTAATLTMLSFRLAKNPKIQEKLVQEVDAYLERHDGKIEHENIGELVYLHACMNETLRLNAPLIRLERVCQKDWSHEPTGLKIKKGMVIQVPCPAVHLDEKNFPDPLEFKPERFLAENKDKLNPYAFLSFGIGNHNCVGMRFAKEEIQMTMATILKDFRIEDCDNAKLEPLRGRAFLNSYKPFNLKLVKRNKSAQ